MIPQVAVFSRYVSRSLCGCGLYTTLTSCEKGTVRTERKGGLSSETPSRKKERKRDREKERKKERKKERERERGKITGKSIAKRTDNERRLEISSTATTQTPLSIHLCVRADVLWHPEASAESLWPVKQTNRNSSPRPRSHGP